MAGNMATTFFVDIIERDDIGIEVYAYLSLGKTPGREIAFAGLKDISVFAGINIGNKPERIISRPILQDSVLIFKLLQIDLALYKADDVNGKYGFQVTPVWETSNDCRFLLTDCMARVVREA